MSYAEFSVCGVEFSVSYAVSRRWGGRSRAEASPHDPRPQYPWPVWVGDRSCALSLFTWTQAEVGVPLYNGCSENRFLGFLFALLLVLGGLLSSLLGVYMAIIAVFIYKARVPWASSLAQPHHTARGGIRGPFSRGPGKHKTPRRIPNNERTGAH